MMQGRAMAGVGAGPGGMGGHRSGDAPSRPIRRGTLGRVLGLYRPYRSQLVAVIALVVVGAALGVATPLLIARVIDDALPGGDRKLLLTLVGAMLALTAAGGVVSIIQGYVSVRIGLRVMQDLRTALYRHLQKQPLSFFTGTRTGDIQSRISNDVMNTQDVLSDAVANIVSNIAVVLSAIIAMLLLSWQLSLVALSLVPVFMFFTVRVGRRRRKLTGEAQRALAEITSRTGETLSVSGVLLAKTFGRERDQIRRFEEDNARLTELSVRQQMTGRAFFIVVQTFFGMAPALVWGLAGWMITGGFRGVTVGEVVAFTTIQVRLLFPLAGLLNRGVDITSALALFDRIFEYMDLKPAITDPPAPVEVNHASIKGEVLFQNVSFAYLTRDAQRAMPSNGRQADEGRDGEFSLHEVDFTAPAGKLTAIVGPSGSGKTTVGYLLARLYDVDSGAVKIDGIDVRDMALADLNRLIGVVTQDTFLFHASIRENLLYGRPTATEEAMIEAAQAAQVHELFSGLPSGYDTVVGERGYRLSGGERQRVAIARVLLADPRILLLDEATSSLDTLNERLIQQALRRLTAGRTTIAIAHRLSTIIAADQIMVMEGGRIVGRGRHEDLLGTSELYRRLYEEQFVQPVSGTTAFLARTNLPA